MNKPQQARAKQSRKMLMEALETLLKDKRFDQITVIDIAGQAQVSTGLLYAHFTNKEAFLEALLSDYKTRIITGLEDAEAEDLAQEYRDQNGLWNALHMLARLAYEQIYSEAHILRAIVYYLGAKSDAEKREWQVLRERAFQTFVPLFEVYKNEIVKPITPQTMAMLAYYFQTIYAEALLLNEGEKTIIDEIGKEAFITEVTDFVYGYLTLSSR